MNARSISKPGAIGAIHSYAAFNDLDVICIAETWLTDGTTDAELSAVGKFMVFRRDRGSRGGGVLVLVRKGIPCVPLPVPSDASEVVGVELCIDTEHLRLVVVYSPGTEGGSADLSSMETLTRDLECLADTPHPIIIVGDMNCPRVLWAEHRCAPLATPARDVFGTSVCTTASSNL